MTGGVWIASYVALWMAVLLLSLAVVVLLRHIGLLHARLRPAGVHPAGEGIETGRGAPRLFEYGAAPLTLVAFTAPSCDLCRQLLPSLGVVDRTYDHVAVRVVSYGDDSADVFRAFNVRSTPYVVAVDNAGIVRGGGVANTLEQVEVLIEAATTARETHA
jgi:hypothetical protein